MDSIRDFRQQAIKLSRRVFGMMLAASIAVYPALSSAKVPASKTDAAGESFESCAMITSEYLTILQLHQKGFTAAQLKASLPEISAQGKKDVDALYSVIERDGIVPTYANINGRYTHCAKQVFDRHGKPPRGSREEHFYFCAGENKLRYQVVLAAYLGGKEKDILPQLPEDRRDLAKSLISMAHKDGYQKTFNLLASQLKRCIVGR